MPYNSEKKSARTIYNQRGNGLASSKYRNPKPNNYGVISDLELLSPWLQKNRLTYYQAKKLAKKRVILLKRFRNRYYYKLNQGIDEKNIRQHL